MNESRLPHEISCALFRLQAALLHRLAQALLFALGMLLMISATLAQATESDDALLRAISGSNLDGFQAALASGASARAEDVNGDTALHRAVIFWGNPAVIEKLLSLGADINATN